MHRWRVFSARQNADQLVASLKAGNKPCRQERVMVGGAGVPCLYRAIYTEKEAYAEGKAWIKGEHTPILIYKRG